MKKPRANAKEARKEITALRERLGWTPSDIINLLRGGGSSSKGSGYERELCKHLSLWWTDGGRDDVFWRSSGSGGRAMLRGRAGAATAGQHGDVAATDPVGAPLIDAFTIEIKRGYSEHTTQDLTDRRPGGGVQVWEQFIAQTVESYENAGSLSWLIIARRDRREAMAWMPPHALQMLKAAGAFGGVRPLPYARITTEVRFGAEVRRIDMVGMTLDAWLGGVTPAMVKTIVETN
jgi:hypothetical protein